MPRMMPAPGGDKSPRFQLGLPSGDWALGSYGEKSLVLRELSNNRKLGESYPLSQPGFRSPSSPQNPASASLVLRMNLLILTLLSRRE